MQGVHSESRVVAQFSEVYDPQEHGAYKHPKNGKAI